MIDSFDFATGRILVRKYEIISKLGYGWEGEVYKLLEIETGIERAGKFFFPERNPNNRTLKFYAKKLHKLRRCGILIHYNTQEQITFRGQKISFLVSEFVEGSLLQEFLDNQRGKRLNPFQGLHLLYALAKGMECIHDQKEYHGDLHTENIIVTRVGLSFDLKLIDLFHLKVATTANMLTDVYDLIRLFYDVIGGAKRYAKQPKEVKEIVCGLKKSLIRKKFRNAGQLRTYLEKMSFVSLPA
ncbi:MAG: protein kinase [Nitrospinota bacterium]